MQEKSKDMNVNVRFETSTQTRTSALRTVDYKAKGNTGTVQTCVTETDSKSAGKREMKLEIENHLITLTSHLVNHLAHNSKLKLKYRKKSQMANFCCLFFLRVYSGSAAPGVVWLARTFKRKAT